LINGSRDEGLAKRSTPAPKSSQPSAVGSEVKKVDKRSTEKKAKTERPHVKAIRKSKSEKLVCSYCGSNDLAPSFIKRRDRRCPNVSASAMDRRHGLGRRRSRSRFAQVDDRGWARKKNRLLPCRRQQLVSQKSLARATTFSRAARITFEACVRQEQMPQRRMRCCLRASDNRPVSVGERSRLD
jgi:23S rRNA A2030 N6-methylase RlmJ